MRNKKGLNLPEFYIGVVVVLIGLGIFIVFFSQLDAKNNIDKDICLASVQARATFNLGLAEPGKDFINLECETEKVCISKSGEDCEAPGFKNSRNNPVTQEKIGATNTAKQKTIDVISQRLYDCHYMLGQGKLNFLPRTWTSKNYCLICSQISLDEQAKQDVGEISYVELYQYMQQKKNNNGESYLEYVYGVESIGEMILNLNDVTNAINEETEKGISVNDLKIDLSHSEGNAIIVQLSPGSTWESWVGGGGTATGVGIAAIGILFAIPSGGSSLTLVLYGGGIAGGSLAIAGIGEATTGGTTLDDSVNLASGPLIITETNDQNAKYSHPTLVKYDIGALGALNCNSFELAP